MRPTVEIHQFGFRLILFIWMSQIRTSRSYQNQKFDRILELRDPENPYSNTFFNFFGEIQLAL